MGQKVSELDAKILQNLLEDGRIGYDTVAQNCGATKNMVWKRTKRMETKGIINGATVQINSAHLNFEGLATLLISVDAQQIDQVMAFIQTLTVIRAYRQYNSVYNIRGVAVLKDLNELDQIKQTIKRRLPVTGLKTYIWTGVRNEPENLDFLGTRPYSAGNTHVKAPPRKPAERATVDQTDMEIINKLTLDGRMPFTKIAQQLDLSTNTVVKRYQKLKENGTIKVSIQLNLNKLGYTALMDCNVAFTSTSKMTDEIVDSFSQIPDLMIVTKTSGDYDLQLTAAVRDTQELFRIQDQISRIEGVTKIEASTRKIPEKWPTPYQHITVL